jgi:DNA-binding NarL/FixJ family response regulator
MSEIKNIAIVDDHTMFRKGLVSLINLFPGYQVQLEAANGQDLLKQLQPARPPDILLLDIVMPEMDGYATAKWIRLNYPDIRILALSTMEGENAIIKMIRNGARGYVLKDAEPTELKRAFDEVLSLGYFFNDLLSKKVLQNVHQLGDTAGENGVFSKLTENELSFLKLACSEKTYFEIAKEMFLSERTIDGYRDSVFKKLNVSTRVGMVLYAIKNGLVNL